MRTKENLLLEFDYSSLSFSSYEFISIHAHKFTRIARVSAAMVAVEREKTVRKIDSNNKFG